MYVGLLSDTHGVFSKEFAEFLSPVDVIWHAGDWGGGLGFAQQIRDLKPVVGVYGNCDGLDIREDFPEYQFFREEGLGVLITHIGGSPGHYYPRAQELIRACKPDLFVCGHSHILKVAWDSGKGLGYQAAGAGAGVGLAGVAAAGASASAVGVASVAAGSGGSAAASGAAASGSAAGAGASLGIKAGAADKLGFLYMNPGAAGIQGWQVVRTALRFKLLNGKVEGLEVFNLPR